MTITQTADGAVAGNWSANFGPPTATCPPDLAPTSTGPVNGANTVVDVHLALLGVGDFRGQVVDRATLKGSLQSCHHFYPVTFLLAGPIPTG